MNDITVSLKYHFYPASSLIDSSKEFQILLEGSIESMEGQVLKSPTIISLNTWTCKTNCHVGYLDNEEYKACKANLYEDKQKQLINFFLSLPVFKRWSRKAILKVITETKLLKVKRNNFIYSPNDIPKYIYIIQRGEYEILRTCMEKIHKQNYLEGYVGPPKEREKRKEFYVKHLLDRKNIGADYVMNKQTLLVI